MKSALARAGLNINRKNALRTEGRLWVRICTKQPIKIKVRIAIKSSNEEFPVNSKEEASKNNDLMPNFEKLAYYLENQIESKISFALQFNSYK